MNTFESLPWYRREASDVLAALSIGFAIFVLLVVVP